MDRINLLSHPGLSRLTSSVVPVCCVCCILLSSRRARSSAVTAPPLPLPSKLLVVEIFSVSHLAARVADYRAEVVVLVGSLLRGSVAATLRPSLFKLVLNVMLRAVTGKRLIAPTCAGSRRSSRNRSRRAGCGTRRRVGGGACGAGAGESGGAEGKAAWGLDLRGPAEEVSRGASRSQEEAGDGGGRR